MDIFIEVYRAYPASFIGRDDLNNTNSSNLIYSFLVILPPSALDKLDRLSINYLI